MGDNATAAIVLEQSVDAIALEVERISEAQRYASRLLEDQNRARIE